MRSSVASGQAGQGRSAGARGPIHLPDPGVAQAARQGGSGRALASGVYTKRLHILAAAAALPEFTVEELVGYSGANENTVRSVVRRGLKRQLFEAIPATGSAQRTGRPPRRYRVADPQEIHAQVQKLERDVTKLTKGLSEQAGLEREQDRNLDVDRWAAIVVAEDAVLRAWEAETPREQGLLAKTALESLSQARRDAERPNDTPDILDRRAQGVSVFAQLALADARGERPDLDQLKQAAEALVDFRDVMPPERIPAFFGGLVDMLERSDRLPPVGIIAEKNASPMDALPELADEGWIKRTLPSTGETVWDLWAQRWAEPLLSRRLVGGVLVYDPGGDKERLAESLAQAGNWQAEVEWHVPTVVMSPRRSMEAVASVAEAGAYFVPMGAGRRGVTATLRNALGRLGLHWFGGVEWPSHVPVHPVMR